MVELQCRVEQSLLFKAWSLAFPDLVVLNVFPVRTQGALHLSFGVQRPSPILFLPITSFFHSSPIIASPTPLLLTFSLFSPILSSLRSPRHSFYRLLSSYLFSFPPSTPISSHPLLASPFLSYLLFPPLLTSILLLSSHFRSSVLSFYLIVSFPPRLIKKLCTW